MMQKDKNKRKIIILSCLFVVLSLIASACVNYVNDYYKADYDAIEAYASMEETEIKVLDDLIVFEPDNPTKGLIFYPGGKVEYTAYKPLMAACANHNILCILVEMPFNLAVLDINAADGLQDLYPAIEDWYIGGHSLGGSMAATYLDKHIDEYKGLILLGSYSTVDLSDNDIDVLSIYGSEDQIMNYTKYEQNKSNLPKDYTEVVIEGGCHAYFGMYGKQDGDGEANISNEEQITLTAMHISTIMD